MGAYSPATPNAYDTTLIPREVRAKYFKEVLLESPLTNFMGDGDDAVIQVIRKKNGTGPTSTFAFSPELDYISEVTGYQQITGTGQDLKFYEDEITVYQRSRSAKLQGLQLVQLDTPVDVFNALRPKLMTAHQRNITYSLLKAATFGSYGAGTPGATFTVGPVADRVVYGRGVKDDGTTSTYDESILTAINGNLTTAPTYDHDGLSVAGIKRLRDMAVLGGTSYEHEKRISPYAQKTREGFPSPMYVYFMSTESYKSLEGDPDWKNFYNRGLIEMPNQPSGLVGSFFRGQIDGVLVYEVPELSKFILGAAQGATGNHTFGWNLFCGAQAFGIIWHKEPWFVQELTNMETTVQMAMLEFRGEKSIKFPSFTDQSKPIEHGIIHHIVKLS